MVLVDDDHGRVVAVPGQEPAGAGGVGVAAQEARVCLGCAVDGSVSNWEDVRCSHRSAAWP
ncbi:hypothetical protein [Streptomyces spinosus]|uniref:hypothetical protein n=1 Tax=Streptomyces spinosus TaxID=2872623 RepID=UPI001CEDAB9F|nr:hypothetical protein [Streptomyces spinosus]